MPDYTRLSIWENDPGKMSWYDYAIGRTRPTDFHPTSFHQNHSTNTEKDLFSVNVADTDREHSWYYELKRQDEESISIRQSNQSKLNAKRAFVIQEPTSSAARQGRLDPYFEYMFANADSEDLSETASSEDQGVFAVQSSAETVTLVETVKSNSNACLQFDQDVLAPVQPDVLMQLLQGAQDFPASTQITPSSKQFFNEQQMIDSYLDALPSAFSDDSQSESDSAQNQLNHCSFHDVTTPPKFDYFDPTYYTDFDVTNNDDSLLNSGCIPSSTYWKHSTGKSVLQPISPRYTFAKNLLAGLSDKNGKKSSKTVKSVKPAVFKTQSVNGKRKVDAVLVDEVYLSGHEGEQQAYTKKVCTISLSDGSRVISHDPFYSPSIRPFSYDRDSVRTNSKDFFKHKPLPSPPKGFVGQFEGMKIDQEMRAVFPFQPHQAFPRIHLSETFGAKTHPNGTFTHTHFRPDPFGTMSEYNDYNISPTHPLTTCMAFATDMTISSCHPNIVALRSKEEEILRREAHIECSSARLEGMAVGFWRYLQGSYGLEEYRQANMCICWDSCECNKMCTRYADLKCPCSQDIVVHGDE